MEFGGPLGAHQVYWEVDPRETDVKRVGGCGVEKKVAWEEVELK